METRRILIIDDDVEFCDELAESLSAEGYSVDCASDPVKGDRLIRGGVHDIILLDYKMQELTGLELLKRLKADNIRKRVLLVTGRPSVERMLEEEGVRDMVSGIIAKPLDFDTLLEKLASD